MISVSETRESTAARRAELNECAQNNRVRPVELLESDPPIRQYSASSEADARDFAACASGVPTFTNIAVSEV